MQLDSFQYPPNDKLLEAHIRANRIGKIREKTNSSSSQLQNVLTPHSKSSICPHCQRSANQCPKLKFFQFEIDLEQRYGTYGPNCVIYLGVIRRIAIFMTVMSVLVAIPLIVLNLLGKQCSQLSGCVANSTIYNWSVYNVIGGAGSGTLPHACIWLIFCIIEIAFCVYLRKYTMETYRRINAINTTDSDFCLLLRRLPENTQPEDIISLIEGICTTGHIQIPREQMTKSLIKTIFMINRGHKLMKYNQECVKEFKKYIREKAIQNFKGPSFINFPLDKFASAVIVRFFEKTAKYKIKQKVKKSYWQKAKNYMCIFYNERTQYRIHNKQISIENAPHPTDMQWNNFGYGQYNRIIRKILLNFSATIVFLISSAITLAISFWIRLLTNTTSGRQPVYLTILIVFITIIFNALIRRIIIHSTKLMRLDTVTDQTCQQIPLLVVHQSLNLSFFSMIAPIIVTVNIPGFIQDHNNKSSTFPLVMFTTIISQFIIAIIIRFLLYYYQVKQKFKRFFHNRKIKLRTQTQAFEAFKGIVIPFSKGYSYLVKFVWFGFIYAIVTPISIPIAAIGLIMFYFFQLILYNCKYSIPKYTGPRINEQTLDLLEWTPLLIGLFNLYLYLTSKDSKGFETNWRILGIIITIIVIGFVQIFIPWKNILKKFIPKYRSYEKNQLHNPSELEITFQESSPLVRLAPNVTYRQGKIGEIVLKPENNPFSEQRFIKTIM